ncbi:MAG: type II CRISPR-associated endonuclease Cas1 [Proteobacteria bacterium]|nr:type II CRISPR-associated endonuclease Cas1 [Pseudomonadota bacterium]
MIDHIIDIAESPARLSVSNGLLRIRPGEGMEAAVPLREVRALIVSHAQVTYTNSVLSRLATEGAAFIVCDERHSPVGMMLPLVGHGTQTERFAQQASVSLPRKKNAWKQIIKAKVRNQGRLLKRLYGTDYGLFDLGSAVRTGDSENIEARAARKYWKYLFGEGSGFKRDFEADGVNAWLNYGYAVIRALVARSLCAAGLHPSLGVHHHNRYDSFCLASDVMEPYRPIVDACAVELSEVYDPMEGLTKDSKGDLLAALTGPVHVQGERKTIFTMVKKTAASLADYLCEEGKELYLPEL